MQYYIYLKQKGEGCDYTIGCGETIVELNCQHHELNKKVSELLDEMENSECEIEKVLVFEYDDNIRFDLETYHMRKSAKKEQQELDERTKQDLETLKKLQEKYGIVQT